MEDSWGQFVWEMARLFHIMLKKLPIKLFPNAPICCLLCNWSLPVIPYLCFIHCMLVLSENLILLKLHYSH